LIFILIKYALTALKVSGRGGVTVISLSNKGQKATITSLDCDEKTKQKKDKC
jgi:hypothetical protein